MLLFELNISSEKFISKTLHLAHWNSFNRYKWMLFFSLSLSLSIHKALYLLVRVSQTLSMTFFHSLSAVIYGVQQSGAMDIASQKIMNGWMNKRAMWARVSLL